MLDARIEARIVIGVTGHRKLDAPDSLRPVISQCLQELRRALPALSHTQYQFCVLSPLADGADRLVADELLKNQDIYLEAVLPMPRDQYVETFMSADSVVEFDRYLAQARAVRQGAATDDETAAYVWVGRHVVEHCDALIAIWDGEDPAGRGGTGEIVRHARSCGRPVLWVEPSRKGVAHAERLDRLDFARLHSLNEHNRLTSQHPLRGTESRLLAELRSAGANLESGAIENAASVAPAYEQADLIAGFFQRRHYLAGTSIYSLAAIAVIIVATQTLFFHHTALGGILELACMSGILALIAAGKKARWHTHWIESRYLAERLRAVMYFTACGLGLSDESRAHWMSSAVSALRSRIPVAVPPSPQSFPAIRDFLAKSWLEDQAAYHRRKARRCEHRHHTLERTGVICFFAAFGACVANLLTFIPGMHDHLHHLLGDAFETIQRALTWISIVAPTSGGAISAINHHREFKKLAHRSDEMAVRLNEMSRRLRDAHTLAEAGPVLTEIEEVVAGENVEWLTNVRFHSLDAPA